MGSPHRKIELQSPSDLTYLTSQIRHAAAQKLDLHLPPVSGAPHPPDELRTHVGTLVDAFVADVLAGMRHNISINGIDVVARGRSGDEVDERGEPVAAMADAVVEDGAGAVEREEYEAFDEKLRSRLAAQVARRDALVAKVSAQRRTTAGAAAERWVERFEREEETSGREMEALERAAGMAGHGEALGGVEIVRAEEVQRSWERAVEGLVRLNKGLPETRARLERCGDVVGYLSGEKK